MSEPLSCPRSKELSSNGIISLLMLPVIVIGSVLKSPSSTLPKWAVSGGFKTVSLPNRVKQSLFRELNLYLYTLLFE